MPKLRSLAAPAAALALLLAAPAGASAAASCADADLIPAAGNLPRIAGATLCLLNQERAAQGLPAVTENDQLTRASADYSLRLVRESFFAHEAPDGTDLVDRLSAAGYIHPSVGVWSVGENLAWAQGSLSSPANVMRAWMNSPGHRANILSDEYREIGLGIVMGTPVPGPTGATFTTDFGRREGSPAGTPAGAAGQAPRPAPAATAAARPPAKRGGRRASKTTKKARKRTVRRRTSRSSRSARARKARSAASRAKAQRAAKARRTRGR
jgi:uncharacterized protein YkwD